jgi:drug/metabolite transporter (DMT)-like permease
LALATGDTFLAASAGAWAALLALGLACQAGAHSAIAFALAHLPAPLAAVTLMVQPLTAGVMAWVILGERLSVVQFAGGVILIGGIVVAQRGHK